MKVSPKYCTRFCVSLRAQILSPKNQNNSITPIPVTHKKDSDVKKETIAISQIISKLRESLIGGRSHVPTNLSFPNERGIDGIDDIDVPLAQLASTAIPKLKKHTKVNKKFFRLIFTFLSNISKR